MLRFYVFGGAVNKRDQPALNAAYAFCLEQRPGTIYWGVGTHNDSSVVVRKGIERVLDALISFEHEEDLQLITSQKSFGPRIMYVIDRHTERQRGYDSDIDQDWLDFALQYRSLGVRYNEIKQVGDTEIFRSVRREAQRRRLAEQLVVEKDPQFIRRDNFNLAADLSEILSAKPFPE